jgi:TDG/mug DNA glycosylase family protein
MDVNNQKVSPEDLQNAVNKTVPDVIAPNLKILFCGINPGLYTAATGYHFGRPGNRFWKVLYEAGFTPRLFHPSEQDLLLNLGYGITNVVARTTARADELTIEEFVQGKEILSEKVLKYTPKFLAVLGIEAYRKGFKDLHAQVGKQEYKIGNTQIWVLPNPSGLNAYYQADKMILLFKELRNEVKR